MLSEKISPCGRFVVLDDLHLDRALFEPVRRWATEHGLRIQDAIQLALCTLAEGVAGSTGAPHAENVSAAPDTAAGAPSAG